MVNRRFQVFYIFVWLPLVILPLHFSRRSAAVTADHDSLNPRSIKQDTPHNVLLLIADDFGVDMTPLYHADSSDLPPTPNIDALLTNGVLFENAWSTPLCSPTRATMLTGRYGFRTDVGDLLSPSDDGLRLDEFTLPEAISAGSPFDYTHANIGKWHLATQQNGGRFSPTNSGYDHFQGLLSGSLGDYWSYQKVTNGTSATSTIYATTDTVDDAIAWLDTQNNDDRPWFLWVAFNAPHSPFHLPPNELHSFDSLPDTEEDIYDDPFPYYPAMVEAMDTEIGRLLASIPSDVKENTTIIFIGDNGTPGQVVQSPLIRSHAKGSLYQGGIHVPLVISGPKVVDPGRSESGLVSSVDIYATVLDLMEIDLAATVPNTTTIDSVSMLPYLTKSTHANPRTFAYSEYFDVDDADENHGKAIRDERYKLILFDDDTVEFYDLQADEHENTDLLSSVDGLSAAEEERYCILYHNVIELLESEPGETVPILPAGCEAFIQPTETPAPTSSHTLTPTPTQTRIATPALDEFIFMPYLEE